MRHGRAASGKIARASNLLACWHSPQVCTRAQEGRCLLPFCLSPVASVADSVHNTAQILPDDFVMKDEVMRVLREGEFAEQRARMLSVDDYLRCDCAAERKARRPTTPEPTPAACS